VARYQIAPHLSGLAADRKCQFHIHGTDIFPSSVARCLSSIINLFGDPWAMMRRSDQNSPKTWLARPLYLSLSGIIKLVARPFAIKGPSDSTVRVPVRWTHLIVTRGSGSLGIASEQHLVFHVNILYVTHFITKLIEFNSSYCHSNSVIKAASTSVLLIHRQCAQRLHKT
jgi:hypothetical protein